MPQFEDTINCYYDSRISTLGRIKTRSLGADPLFLSALTVLAYAQLEGGVKEVSACVIKNVNARKMELGEVSPLLLKWRNHADIAHCKAIVDFDMIGAPSPFDAVLKRRVTIGPINRRRELNQMGSAALKRVYEGFRLDYMFVQRSAAQIDALVDARNQAAHHGAMPSIGSSMLESQVRANVILVEDILTDLSLQLLNYFAKGLHKRA